MGPALVALAIGCGPKPGDSDPPRSTSPSSDTATGSTDSSSATNDSAAHTGDSGSSEPPLPLAWVSISAGTASTCGVLNDGRLICFGSEYGGILASAPTGGVWSAVSVGSLNACVLDSAGYPTCWGCDSYGSDGDPCLSPPEPFVTIESAPNLNCAARANGTVACWGSVPLAGYPPFTELGGPFRDVAVADRAICTVDDVTGAPDCLEIWGVGLTPVPPGLDLSALAISTSHGCGLHTADGTVVCWGTNFVGSPFPPPPPGSFVDVKTYFSVTCLLAADGSITCFDPVYPTAPASPPPGTYSMLTMGRYHGCALDTVTGEMVCWGGVGAGEADPPLLAELALPTDTGTP